MKILGTGLTGLVGSRIVELLQDSYEFENCSRATGVDIANEKQISEKISSSDASFVLHLAAQTDVDQCEEEKSLGEESTAWKTNVVGTRNVASVCKKTGKKLIFISTDFVFDGEHAPENGYTEADSPNPVNFYGLTKFEAEKAVVNSGAEFIIARIAYPYRSKFGKNDFARSMLSRLEKSEPVTAVTDHVFTPTFIDDIAFALHGLITKNESGMFHVAGNQWLTPYDAAGFIAQTFQLPVNSIQKTTRDIFFEGKAKRGFQLKMNSDKIEKLGIKMKTFEEGLEEVKRQRDNL